MMLRIADEFYQLYHVGVRVVDHSLAVGADEREFWLRVALLLWIGDYPGQGEVSGFKSVVRMIVNYVCTLLTAQLTIANVC